jgi:hypothetical protein
VAEPSRTSLDPGLDLVREPADSTGADLHAGRKLTRLFEPPNLRRAQSDKFDNSRVTKYLSWHFRFPMFTSDIGKLPILGHTKNTHDMATKL